MNDALEEVVAKRLLLSRAVAAACLEIVDDMPDRFRRGDYQRVICYKVKIPFIGLNKRLVNEVMFKLGFKKVYLDGHRFYRRIKHG